MLAKVSFDSDEPLFVNRLVCIVMVLLSRLDSNTNSAVVPTGPNVLIANPACDCIARGENREPQMLSAVLTLACIYD